MNWLTNWWTWVFHTPPVYGSGVPCLVTVRGWEWAHTHPLAPHRAVCWALYSTPCTPTTAPLTTTATPSSNTLSDDTTVLGVISGGMRPLTGRRQSGWQCGAGKTIWSSTPPKQKVIIIKRGHSRFHGYPSTIHRRGQCGKGGGLPLPGSPSWGGPELGLEHLLAAKKGPAETALPEGSKKKQHLLETAGVRLSVRLSVLHWEHPHI